MHIKDVMTRDIITIKPSTGIRQIYSVFCKKQIGGMPVVDAENKLLGMVTKTELLNVLIPDYFDMIGDFLFIDDFGVLEEKLESTPTLSLFIAEDLMIRNVISISENASLMKAPVLMNRYNVKRLPVVDSNNKLVGIITRMDVCKALFDGAH
ncbi:MAG: CBS domain-containing protein [Candidatus Omnitrophota bacterium]|nr:MAG: CBS domain-containing protein [Candidatus Omnitrophota bacterium]